MAIQSAVTVDILREKETAWGELNGSPDMARQRRVSSTLGLEKDTFQSAEARTDRNISDFRHGGRRVTGDLVGELSLEAWDWAIENGMGTAWDTEISDSNTEFTSVALSSGTWTMGGGSMYTEGYKVGDVVTFGATLSESANNNVNFIITSIPTATTFTTIPTGTDMTSDTTFTITRTGRKTIVGSAQDSYTIEQGYPDISQYELFTGCSVSQLGFNLPATGMAGITASILGKDALALTGATRDGTPTVVTGNDILAAANGSLVVDTSSVAVVTGMNFTVNNNITSESVVGANVTPDLFWGQSNASGTMTAFFEDATLINAFINETAVKIHMLLEEPTGTPGGFMKFSFNNVKFGGATKDIPNSGGVLLTLPFQALKTAGASGFDVSAVTIQVSNNS
jgi:hypothetical protein